MPTSKRSLEEALVATRPTPLAVIDDLEVQLEELRGRERTLSSELRAVRQEIKEKRAEKAAVEAEQQQLEAAQRASASTPPRRSSVRSSPESWQRDEPVERRDSERKQRRAARRERAALNRADATAPHDAATLRLALKRDPPWGAVDHPTASLAARARGAWHRATGQLLGNRGWTLLSPPTTGPLVAMFFRAFALVYTDLQVHGICASHTNPHTRRHTYIFFL